MNCEVVFVLLFMSFMLGNAQRISPNPCPTDRPIQQNFDVEKVTTLFFCWLSVMNVYIFGIYFGFLEIFCSTLVAFGMNYYGTTFILRKAATVVLQI